MKCSIFCRAAHVAGLHTAERNFPPLIPDESRIESGEFWREQRSDPGPREFDSPHKVPDS